MRYCSDGFGTIDAANIRRAARIFATRFAHQKYGPKGRYRTLRLCLDRGGRGASFEAVVEVLLLQGIALGRHDRAMPQIGLDDSGMRRREFIARLSGQPIQDGLGSALTFAKVDARRCHHAPHPPQLSQLIPSGAYPAE
jgi:hypothetical protein